MTTFRIAAAQFGSTDDPARNLERFRAAAEQAAEQGSRIVCFPELANTTYFCWESRPEHFSLAEPIPGPTTDVIGEVARSTDQAIVCSVFEKASERDYYNTAFIVDRRGELVGRYRKNSIPLSVGHNGVAANEKMYFRPGDLGFPVFDIGEPVRIGVLICYDRHFPEAARALALGGADILFVPTATWREPMKEAWEIELRAHAVSNAYYVCGVNKVGLEEGGSPTNAYFGTSLIVDPRANVLARASGTEADVIVADVDLEALAEQRRLWPVFRDRRPDAYGALVR